MDLHDFLARSLDLLVLIEAIEQHQKAMTALVSELDAAPVGSSSCVSSLEHLRERHRSAGVALNRAIELLADFQ